MLTLGCIDELLTFDFLIKVQTLGASAVAGRCIWLVLYMVDWEIIIMAMDACALVLLIDGLGLATQIMSDRIDVLATSHRLAA